MKIREIEAKLESIESLVKEKKFKQALAGIREIQREGKTEEFSSQGGNFYYLSAIVFHSLGNYKEALFSAKKAFGIFSNTKDYERLAPVQISLGKIYRMLGDLKSAELEFRDVFCIYRRNKDYAKLTEVCNQLAGVYYLQSDYKNAIDFLNESIKCCKKVNDFENLAKSLGNTGQVYLRIGDWLQAEKNLLLNVKVNEENKDEINLSRGLLSLGNVYFLKREFHKAHLNYQKALKIIHDQNYVREYAIYHEYSGELAFAQDDYKLAQEHYTQAIEIGEKIAPQSGIISQSYRLLSDLQVAKKEYDQAMVSCNKSLEVCLDLGERIEEACCYRILGQINSAKEETKKAKEYFEKSIQLLQEIGARYELAKAYLQVTKSSCFDFFERLKFSGLAGDIFKDLKVPFWMAQVKFEIANLLFESQECQKSLSFLNEAENILESINDESELKRVLDFKQKVQKNISGEGVTFKPNLKFSFSDIVTQNTELCEIKHKMEKIKDTDLNILLEGETGTGKDLFAKVIHYTSKRKHKSFVIVNCPTIPETLFESELFGYKKGAFSGASYDKKGWVEEADAGTLFLNEIGELPLPLQAKLLQMIEEKQFSRLGETKPRKVNIRLIAATNKDLALELKSGRFRKDLYYRLNTMHFRLPPLRERKEDIHLLINRFVEIYSGQKDEELSQKILDIFIDYNWPGNIRELENEVKRIITLRKLGEKGVEKLFSSNSDVFQGKDKVAENSLLNSVQEFEREKIQKALREANGVKVKAAKVLNLPLTTLISKIKKYNL